MLLAIQLVLSVRNKLLWMLKLLVSCSLLGYLLSRMELDRLRDILTHADIRWLIIPVVLWVISLALSSLKWGILLRVYGLALPFKKIFHLYCIGSFFNNFLPTSIGGDSYKFIALNREYPENKSILLSSMLLERGLGVLAVLMTICVFAPLVDDSLLKHRWNLVFFMLSGIGVATIFIMFGRKKNIPTTMQEGEGILTRFARLIHIFLSFSSPKAMIMSLGISILSVFISALSIYSLFLCFGYQPPLFLVFYLHPLISLFGLLPISINNFGVAESAGYYFYSLYGISPEAALIVYFVSNLLLVFCTSIGALLFVIRK